MNAEILAVGTELLLGDILNTNAQYLSKQLALLGIGVYYQTVVGDNEDRLYSAYKNAFERADLVITTGGLGPTDDDLTKEIGAKYFNKELILNENWAEKVKCYFKKNHNMPKTNLKQAYIPEDAIILDNDNGTAPGCIIEENNKILIMLPGPPNECMPMFEKSVIPFLKSKQSDTIQSKVLHLCGIGESAAAEAIRDLMNKSENPTIAPYAKTNEVLLRVTAKAENEESAEKLIEPVVSEIYNILGKYIYGEDNTSIEKAIMEKIIEKGFTISVAESCTGGKIVSKLVNYAGASKVLIEGIVTYSNESKINRLNVKKETLDNFGAVSEQTAKEMAEGIAEISGSNIGISTTGIAGPEGGSEEKPVGLVYIGICINGKTVVKELNLRGNREKIRSRAAIEALNMLRCEINNI